MSRKTRLAYLVSHPIQYQAPLLRLIDRDPDIDLTVFFCSDYSVRAHRDEGFGQTIEWDIPLLEGYKHQFLPAAAGDGPPPVFRPVNRGLARLLRDGDYDVLWVHGYMRLYHLISMVRARLQGITVLNRDEAWSQSARRGPVKNAIKRLFFAALRRVCNGWLVIGSANRDYYLANGMASDSLFLMPYAVDNQSFRVATETAAESRDALRDELGLVPNRPVVLFASKFQARKRPFDLLEAFARISRDPSARRPYLVLVGDGEQRGALERKSRELGIETAVRFTGFRNQTEIPRYYDLCDVFVLPSLLEPWGLVVNEVMNAGRAVIVSDQVGAGPDLVQPGRNGFVFPAGDVEVLSECLQKVLSDPDLCERMGRESLAIIETWGFEQDLSGLKQALDYSRKGHSE
jgi:glycosyltransferase involved in cell wall biosynthesis